jgi:hypothetical protein
MIHHKVNIHQFNEFPLEDRAKHAWVYGRLIGARVEEDLQFYLYCLSNFYVEIAFDEKDQEITNIQAINHTKGLEPYVLDLSLEALF